MHKQRFGYRNNGWGAETSVGFTEKNGWGTKTTVGKQKQRLDREKTVAIQKQRLVYRNNG